MTTPPAADPRAVRVIAFFEQLKPEDTARIATIYAADAYFRDPFNEVRGPADIARIFDAMFARLADCRFAIREVVADEHGMMLTWDFTFRMKSYRPATVQTIHGASHLKFDGAGRIAYHRDYWDAAEELYAKLPLIGPVMRFLQRRLA
jgi:steroid Delta-isomerase